MILKDYKKFIEVMDWCELSYFIMQVENDLRTCDMDSLEIAYTLQALQYAEERKQVLMPSPSTVMSYGNLPQIRGTKNGH